MRTFWQWFLAFSIVVCAAVGAIHFVTHCARYRPTHASSRHSTTVQVPFEAVSAWLDSGRVRACDVRKLLDDGHVDIDVNVLMHRLEQGKSLSFGALYFGKSGNGKTLVQVLDGSRQLTTVQRLHLLLLADDERCSQAAISLATSFQDTINLVMALGYRPSRLGKPVLLAYFEGTGLARQSEAVRALIKLEAAISLLAYDGEDGREWLFDRIRRDDSARQAFVNRCAIGLAVCLSAMQTVVDLCIELNLGSPLCDLAVANRSFIAAVGAVEIGVEDPNKTRRLLDLFMPKPDPVSMYLYRRDWDAMLEYAQGFQDRCLQRGCFSGETINELRQYLQGAVDGAWVAEFSCLVVETRE